MVWCSMCRLKRYLTIDIPRTPLFKDSQGGNIIPQIPLYNVLEKFNGQHVTVGSLTHSPTLALPMRLYHLHPHVLPAD